MTSASSERWAAAHDTLSVRPLSADEWEDWYRVLEIAFGGGQEEPEERQLWHELTELDRSLAVWDADQVVGSAGAFSFRLAVPGGTVVPTAGVTMVGVLPTHRRRGVLTALMRRQLDDVHDRGEALAALTAFEPAIYGRYGYGLATWRMAVEVPRIRVRVAGPSAEGVRLRLADPAVSSTLCEKLYAGRVPLRPGMLERRPGWDRLPLLDAPGSRGGFSPLQCVLAEDADSGRPLGYARYAAKVDWPGNNPVGTVRLRDIEAVSPQVYAALWAYLLDLDLMDAVVAHNRPTDDPLLHLVSDPRRLTARIEDSLFVRLVDVGAALRERGYAAPVDVVLEVVDEFCPWNAGCWRLRGEGPGKGASCEPTMDRVDLTVNVRELGSAYLGGVTLAALARAGLVTEVRPGALAEASTAFSSDIAPWLPHGF